jgi:hypothetical protein
MLFKLIAQYRDREAEDFNVNEVYVIGYLINHFDRGAVSVTILPMERTV